MHQAPANIHLAVTAERVISQHFREQILDRALKRLAGQYDVTLLDCPPNLGVITANAIYTTSRRLRLKQWWSQTACSITSAGKRKPR